MIKFEDVDIKKIAADYASKYGKDASQQISGLMYPEKDPTFVIKPSLAKLFYHLLYRASQDKRPDNILLKGPPGCGKTETAMQFAAISGLPLLKVNCPLVREPRDWFGSKTVENSNVLWVESEFCKAVERGGVVILLDEISRATPPVLNSLLPLLDSTGASFLEEMKQLITLGKDVFFFATANIGKEFSGTYGKLDKALDDRFGLRIEVDYLEPEKEINLLVARTGISKTAAKSLVKVANAVRQNSAGNFGGKFSTSLSTRNLLDAANLYNSLGVEAFDYTLIPLFSAVGGPTSDQTAVRQYIQSQFKI